MKMNDWIEDLDNQILLNRRKVLAGKGKFLTKKRLKKQKKNLLYIAKEK